MQDTNTVSYIIKGAYPKISEHLRKVPLFSICISAITEAELLTGLAKKPKAKKLHLAVHEFLIRVAYLNGIQKQQKLMQAFVLKVKVLANHSVLWICSLLPIHFPQMQH